MAGGGQAVMAELKLQRLPDRVPVKLPLTLPPELAGALEEYRNIYNERLAAEESLQEIALGMLAAFLASDREFQRLREAQRKSGK